MIADFDMLEWHETSQLVDEETAEAVKHLHVASYMFRLTGSRYFGSWQRRSDFDFFTENTASINSYLKSKGFVIVLSGDYTDALTDLVYRKGKVHVQIINNVLLKQRIQKAINDSGVIGTIMRGSVKEITRKLWDLGVKLADPIDVAKPQVTVESKFCSCPGEKVRTTVNGRDFFNYCRGCKKECKP